MNSRQLELARQRINRAAFVDYSKPFKEGWYWECRKCHQKLCEDYPDITIDRIEKALAEHKENSQSIARAKSKPKAKQIIKQRNYDQPK